MESERMNLETAVEKTAQVFGGLPSLTPSQIFDLALQLVPLVSESFVMPSLERCIALTDEKCTPFTVVSAAALALRSSQKEQARITWKQFVVGLLCASPPYPGVIVAQVATCCAKFYIDSVELVRHVFEAASSVLEASEDGKMPFANAVEVLARAASYVVSVPEGGAVPGTTLLQAQQALVDTSLRALDRAHRDVTTPQLITRRILVPVLTAPRTVVSGEGLSLRGTLSASARGPLMSLLHGLAAKNLFGEVVILHAAMFEYFFPTTHSSEAAAESDYRFDPFLWNSIISALRLACTTAGTGLDAGRRATIQLQALYLLKRIVSITAAQADSSSSPSKTSFHTHFHWKRGVSAGQWETAFLLFETLNEYGLHIIQPALLKLDADLAGPEGLEPIWIELIFTKLVQHANVGVRKVGLRKLWQMDALVVRRLSDDFVFGTVFAAAADVRLCSELERIISPSNFLDSKGFDGRVESQLPHILPMADHTSRFYSSLVSEVARQCDMDGLRSAFAIIIGTATTDATRFHISMLIRTLYAMAKATTSVLSNKCAEKMGTVDGLMNDALASRVATLLKDVLQDKHPYFLECRLNAVAVSFILELGHGDMTLLQQDTGKRDAIFARYRKLLALATVLGDTGGKALAAIDAAGTVGPVGAALTSQDLADQLRRVASSGPQNCVADVCFKEANALHEKVRALLSASTLDVTVAREGLLFADLADDGVKSEAASSIIREVKSACSRPYANLPQVLTPLLLLGEFTSNVKNPSVFFSEEDLREAADGVESLIAKYLLQVTSLIFSVQNDVSNLSGASWDVHRTDEWDTLCCGLFALQKLLDAIVPQGTWDFDLSRHMDILESISAMAEAIKAGPQQLAYLVVMRNAAKIVYTFAAAASIGAASRSAMPLRILDAAQIAHQLMQLKPLHLWSADVPCSLTSHTWGTIISQYFRYLYNAIYTCCLAAVQQASQVQDQAAKFVDFLSTVKEYALAQLDCCSASNLSSIYDILLLILGVPQSLAAVIDPADLDKLLPPHERHNIVRLMMARQKDTQRREYFRCAAMANFALPLVQETSQDRAQLAALAIASASDDNDRVVFFVAAAIVVDFLKDVPNRWGNYKDFLLHMAVFVNGSHDEDEFEACVAAMEPAFARWPDSVRERSPPTIRMHSTARALCLSAILWACHADRSLAVSLSVELIRWNTKHPVIKKEPCMPNSNTHRCRIRLWQLICSLRPIGSAAEADADEVAIGLRKIVTAMIDECMPINNMGSVRRYLELYLIAAFGQCYQLSDVLVGMLDDFSQRPQVMGSIALISFHAARDALQRWIRAEAGTTEGKNFELVYKALFQRLLRMCSSHQYLLRIVSHIAVFHLVQSHLAQHVPVGDDAMALYHYIEKAPECIRFREKHESFVVFNGEEALSPEQIFCFQRKEATVWLKESIPASTFERMQFLEAELSCILGATTPFELLRSRALCSMVHANPSLFHRFKSFPYIPHDPRHSPANHYLDYTFELLSSQEDPLENKQDAATDNIQRKATSWWNSEVYNELHPRALGINKRQSLIIVGSLLENPVNIAGLCRCGEIFTVEKVTVPDKKVFDHPHFIAAARSAELWLPWEEVFPANLPVYLSACRDAGYTLIGIEQTANSVSIATFEFPSKCVIVLGSEGHGIPAPLLPLLDVCVEIPQYGLIRSLNVHVTGAVVMYEYTKQFLMATMKDGAQHPSNIGAGMAAGA